MRLPTLYQFFHHQVQYGFDKHGLAEPATVDYVSDVLTRFAHTRALCTIRDHHGRPLERIADLLSEWHGGWPSNDPTRDRHRQAFVARHIGEYTLFMSGLFRDRLQVRGELDYYVRNGRSAFRHCAHYELSPKRQRLFRGLHLNFGHIADALDDMVRFQFPFASAGVTANTFLKSLWRV